MSFKSLVTLLSVTIIAISTSAFADSTSNDKCTDLAKKHKIEITVDDYMALSNKLHNQLMADLKDEKISKKEADKRIEVIAMSNLCAQGLLVDEADQVIKSLGL